MTWFVTSLRRLRDGPAVSLGLALAIGATAFVFAIAPRLLDRSATGILRTQVAALAVDVRSPAIIEEQRLSGSPGQPLAGIDEEGAALAARVPAGVTAIAPRRDLVVDTPRWSVVSQVPSQSTIRLRIQPGSEAHLRITAGRPPGGASRTIPVPPGVQLGQAGPGTESPGGSAGIAVVEGILPEAAARTLGLQVGDVVIGTVDRTDRFGARASGAVGVEVVGTYVVLDRADEWWFSDPSAFDVVVRNVGNNDSFNDATALLSPDAYPALYDATAAGRVPFRLTWRWAVVPATLDAGQLGATIDALRRLETAFPSVPVVQGPQLLPALRDGLLAYLREHATRWSAASAVIEIVAVGPVIVALLALAFVALLAARRRRFALALAAGRGASAWQVAASAAGEGLAVGLPAVAVAVAAAVGAVPDGSVALSAALAVGVAVAVAGFLVVASLPAARGGPPLAGSREVGIRRTSARRLALEGLLVVLALGGALLLRARGGVLVDPAGGAIGGASAAGGAAGAAATGGAASVGAAATGLPTSTLDLFIMAVPALLGAAGGLVAIRLYPLPMRLLARLAGARRDLVPALALRRATRGTGGGSVLAVLLATATVATFAGATLVHLDRVADAAGWQTVGAPFRLVAGASAAGGTKSGTIVALPAGLDPATLPGVTVAAPYYGGAVSLFPQTTRVEFLAVDGPAYGQLGAGTPADPGLPPAFLATSPSSAGGPIPAIVSPNLPIGPAAPRPGDRFQATILSRARDFVVVEVRPIFPSIEPGADFFVAPLAALDASVVGDVPATGAFLLAPEDAAAGLRRAAAAAGPGLAIESRAEVSAALAGSPFIGAVTGGVEAAAILAALYAALAVTAALALSGAARADEVGQLRTLGLTRRSVLGLAAVEHGPTVVAAFVAGTALGLGIFLLLRPALGLADLAGSGVDVPLAIEPALLGLILAGMTAISVLGIGLAALLQGRAALALAIRRRAE
jgi:putative ABC transport system permease protein